jgi:CheY-like chemotaxis protein
MRGRILIVEDDRPNREALSRLLQHLGYAVETAATVMQGIQKLQERPQCMIVDLELPDGLGLEVVRAARAAAVPCKVALFTGSMDPMDHANGEPALDLTAADVDAMFIKPAAPKQVLDWVESNCRD